VSVVPVVFCVDSAYPL